MKRKSENGKNSFMKNNKITNLRALAIMLVVLGHSIILYKSDWNYYTTNQNCQLLNYICLFIYLFHMPLFFSISGYLFIDGCTMKKFSVILRNKFKRLIVPYLIIGILWVYPIRIISNYSGFVEHGFWYNIIINIILGRDNGHLWFLPSLFLMFIISYFLEKYVKNRKVKFLLILSMFLLGHVLNLSWFSETLKFIICFYFGNFIKKYSIENKIKYRQIVIVAALFFICMYFITYNLSAYISLLFKYCVCLAILPLLYNIISNREITLLQNISNCSFGIYLFHSPMIYLTFCFLPNINPMLMVLINFFGFGFVAYFITKQLSNSKFKFIIGG